MGDIFAVEMMKKKSNFREIVYIFFAIWRNLGLRKFTKTLPLNENNAVISTIKFRIYACIRASSKLSGYEIIIQSISPSSRKSGARILHGLRLTANIHKTVVKIINLPNFTWKH